MNLNQITVPSINLSVSISFYENLGLKLIVKDLPNYARFECPKGNATFSLHQSNDTSQKNGIWIYFECENLDDYVKQLLNKGIAFEEMPTNKSWLWRESRLKDPDGNQIILYFAGDNRINPPWKIK